MTRFWVLNFGTWDLGCGFRVYGLGFRVLGVWGCRVWLKFKAAPGYIDGHGFPRSG